MMPGKIVGKAVGKTVAGQNARTGSVGPAPSQAGEGAVRRHARDRHTRRIAFGLTGVLGFAWAVVIAGRYTGFLAG